MHKTQNTEQATE